MRWSSSRTRPSAISLVVVALLGVALGIHGRAAADFSGSSIVSMYSKLTRTSAVWTGTKAYYFGGSGSSGFCCQGVNHIVQVDPATRTVTKMGATLPSHRSYTSAVWTGEYAYVFGGRWDAITYHSDVLRYDPSTDTISSAGPSLISPIAGTSAVWSGTKAYIFGGISRFPSGYTGPTNFVQRFDPVAGTVESVGGLVRTRFGSSAAWDGRYAYIFGGWNERSELVCEVERFDPVTEQSALTGASLCLGDSAATFDGYNVFVFAGETGPFTYSPSIHKYSPEANSVTTMSASLGGARRSGVSAIWADGRALIFGGSSCASYSSSSCSYFDSVATYNVQPNTPAGLQAKTQTTGGVLLTWNATPSNTYSAPLQGYRLARTSVGAGGVGASKTFVVSASSTSYEDLTCSAGMICLYYIQAFNAQGASNYSSNQVVAAGV